VLLWIRKVAGVLNGMIRDTDPQAVLIFPIVPDVSCALWDGRALCGLIAYYKPALISVTEVVFEQELFASWHGRDDPAAATAAVGNLELVRMVAAQLGCACPATATDLIEGSPAITTVVVAWLAELFEVLEQQPVESRLKAVAAAPVASSPTTTMQATAGKTSRPQSRKGGSRPASAAVAPDSRPSTSAATVGGGGRPTSGRPGSARPTARPSTAGRPLSSQGGRRDPAGVNGDGAGSATPTTMHTYGFAPSVETDLMADAAFKTRVRWMFSLFG
jgi:hypothetical protein